ncbi:MAG TPA: SCO family protein [Verrucomicrobiae bacterium]|nr:SCO family protein [Verrucomicrobiae bacterium]
MKRVVDRMLLVACCSMIAFAFARTASAQTLSDDQLKRISFDQKLGAQVSPDLQFHDETGKTVKLGAYFGKKPAILVLGYYRCPMLCSFVLNGMIGSLQDIKWEIGNQFDVIDVSIDPHEKPELAAAKKKAYVRRYGRYDSSDGWHFLTGDEPAIRKLAGEVGFGYAYDSKVQEYAHPSGLIVLTPEGKVSHYISGVIFSTKELNDALVDASTRKVGSPIQQLFLLCFHYSPMTGKYGALILRSVRVCGVSVMLLLGYCLFKGVTGGPGRAAPKSQDGTQPH